MKRRDFERHLRRHGAMLAREGAEHSIWAGASGTAAVPHHKEIKFTVARSICKALEIPAPSGR